MNHDRLGHWCGICDINRDRRLLRCDGTRHHPRRAERMLSDRHGIAHWVRGILGGEGDEVALADLNH